MSAMFNSPGLGRQEKSQTSAASDFKPVIIGLYGVQGSGKTSLMNQLKLNLETKRFAFYDGSEVIGLIVPGGLAEFQKLEGQKKAEWRGKAIEAIAKRCSESKQVAIVAGHYMFWREEDDIGEVACTTMDWSTYTHVLYLNVPAEIIQQRRLNDAERPRPLASVGHLRKWQAMEQAQLRRECREHGILFSLVPPELNKISTMVCDFGRHDEKYNLTFAEEKLDRILMTSGRNELETVLVLDGDRTLAADDTGERFWEMIPNSQWPIGEGHPLKTLFSSALRYSHTAFRQATLLYEEVVGDDQHFHNLCKDVASTVKLHPEMLSLLRAVTDKEHIGVLIITCGLRHIWESVLERGGLSNTVKVIGGGRLADGFVVSPAVKGALVRRLRQVHRMSVWAFGDSPMDMNMLGQADQAIVVVGEINKRSKTMDAALENAIDKDGLQARQVLLPSNASPRLNTSKLPLVKLTDPDFVNSILTRRGQKCVLHYGRRVLHATGKPVAMLLMTAARDANIAGPLLREAHRRIGEYLATEFLTYTIGLEPYSIQDVLDRPATGYRLLHEKETTIVALMRGGEPMASGVNDTFPSAMFVHAGAPGDLKPHHLQGQQTVILVDSVVNSGKTVVDFVNHIRTTHPAIRIVVVAYVVQEQSISRGDLSQLLIDDAELSLVALRLSETKFTGSGTTDTGNRLFNTTHLP